MIKSALWSLLFSFCFLIIETVILSNIVFLPVVPDLVLICLIYVSFYNGCSAGETHGFITGFMIDFLSAAPLGLNSLIRTVTGFITGLLKDMFNIDKIFFPAILGCLGTLLKALLLLIVSFLFGDSVSPYKITDSYFWIELCMNTILTPLMFAFLNLFSDLLLFKQENSNYVR